MSVGNERPTQTVVHKWVGAISCPPLQTTPSRYPQVFSSFSSGVFFLFSFKMTSLTSSSLKAYKEELGHFLDVVQGFTECQVWNWRWINIMCWSSGDCSNGVRCSKDLRRLC